MARTSVRLTLAAALLAASASTAIAGGMSKEDCIDAHSRGQDAREQGKISLARKLFLTCAQSTCPALVQGDCAKYADDLTQQQPSLTFAARDANGNDLPDTTVYVDDTLIVTRLDDGKPHDADPGKHVVKFSNGGRDQVVTVILNAGEKGRTVVGTFPAAPGAPGGASPAGGCAAQVAKAGPEVHHPMGAKVVTGLGAVGVVAGTALYFIGGSRVPSNCSTSSHQCIGPANDPSLKTASDAVHTSNLGMVIGGIGGAALVGGLVWYFKGESKDEAPHVVAAPWVSPNGAGFAVTGPLW
jgi:hypothetical protein